MKSKRLVDPVHLFNSEGVPMLTIKHLTERNALLQSQVERLTRMLRAQVYKNRAIASQPQAVTKFKS